MVVNMLYWWLTDTRGSHLHVRAQQRICVPFCNVKIHCFYTDKYVLITPVRSVAGVSHKTLLVLLVLSRPLLLPFPSPLHRRLLFQYCQYDFPIQQRWIEKSQPQPLGTAQGWQRSNKHQRVFNNGSLVV